MKRIVDIPEGAMLTDYPEIANQWHPDPEKNNGVRVEEVMAKSAMRAVWYLSYFDLETGKTWEFEWEVRVCDRIRYQSGCPYLSGKKIREGFNDLGTIRPDKSRYWHPTLNGDLTPAQVSPYSKKTVYWLYPFDDPETGRHFDFVWEMPVNQMVSNTHDCPYLLSDLVWPGFNDLESRMPALAMEWHPYKNDELMPHDVTVASGKKVWWFQHFIDPETGKSFYFEWQARISDRSIKGAGNPFSAGKDVWPGYNDLATRSPVQAAKFNAAKNGTTPDRIVAESHIEYWWIYPYDDPRTGRHFDFEWKASPHHMIRGNVTCPYLAGRMVQPGFNDLATFYPQALDEWDFQKNKALLGLTPETVSYGSDKEVFWRRQTVDPETGKVSVVAWEQSVYAKTHSYNRSRDVRGPFISLADAYPELAEEWHRDKNGCLTPDTVPQDYEGTVWWQITWIHPVSKKKIALEWEDSPLARINGADCPYLTGKKSFPGFNDFATLYPEEAAQWHPSKNGLLRPDDFPPTAGDKVWWLLPYDDEKTGKHFDFEWQASIKDRAAGKGACPYLYGRELWPGFNDLATMYPELAAQWSDKNDLSPSEVTCGISNRKFLWTMHYFDDRTGRDWIFEWEARIPDRITAPGCPYLTYGKAWPGFNDLATTHPGLATQWHPTKNGNLRPTDVTAGSKKDVWWYLPYDDARTGKHFEFEWHTAVQDRALEDHGCPFLSNTAVWTGFNDLKTCYPSVSDEWDYDKNHGIMPGDIYKLSTDKYWWKCSNGHSWYSIVRDRIRFETECPECRRIRHANGLWDIWVDDYK